MNGCIKNVNNAKTQHHSSTFILPITIVYPVFTISLFMSINTCMVAAAWHFLFSGTRFLQNKNVFVVLYMVWSISSKFFWNLWCSWYTTTSLFYHSVLTTAPALCFYQKCFQTFSQGSQSCVSSQIESQASESKQTHNRDDVQGWTTEWRDANRRSGPPLRHVWRTRLPLACMCRCLDLLCEAVAPQESPHVAAAPVIKRVCYVNGVKWDIFVD